MQKQVIIFFGCLILLLALVASFQMSITGHGTYTPGRWVEKDDVTIPLDSKLPYLYFSRTTLPRGTSVDLHVYAGTSGMYTLKLYRVGEDNTLQFIKDIRFIGSSRTSLVSSFSGYRATKTLSYVNRPVRFDVSRAYLPGNYRFVAEGGAGTTTLDFKIV